MRIGYKKRGLIRRSGTFARKGAAPPVQNVFDVFLGRAALLSQVITAFVAIIVYFYTVVPINQKEQLSETNVDLQKDISRRQAEVASLTQKERLMAGSIHSTVKALIRHRILELLDFPRQYPTTENTTPFNIDPTTDESVAQLKRNLTASLIDPRSRLKQIVESQNFPNDLGIPVEASDIQAPADELRELVNTADLDCPKLDVDKWVAAYRRRFAMAKLRDAQCYAANSHAAPSTSSCQAPSRAEVSSVFNAWWIWPHSRCAFRIQTFFISYDTGASYPLEMTSPLPPTDAEVLERVLSDRQNSSLSTH